MNKCNKCAKAFKGEECKVGCGFCGKWYHITCGKVPKALFNTLENNPQIHWYCENCNEKANEVLPIVQKYEDTRKELVQKYEDTRKELTKVQETVTKMKNGEDPEFKEIIKHLVEGAIREKMNDAENNPSTEAIREIAKKEVHENNDKKGRECNFVVAGIDEEKEDADKEIEDMLAFLDVTVEVSGIRRMGKDKQDGKTRPVWVRVDSKKERNAVLEKAKKLRDDDRWKNVYINRDMTEAERKEAYNLRVELRARREEERRENGTRRFVIHRGQVIRKENAREPATEEAGIQDEQESD